MSLRVLFLFVILLSTNASKLSEQLSTGVQFKNWQDIPDVLFFILVMIYSFQQYGVVQLASKKKKWGIIAQAFPTLEMYEAAYLESDSPGKRAICEDWGTENIIQRNTKKKQEGSLKKEREKCWENMITHVGDITWKSPQRASMDNYTSLDRSKFRIDYLAIGLIVSCMLLVMIYPSSLNETRVITEPNEQTDFQCPTAYHDPRPRHNLEPSTGFYLNTNIDSTNPCSTAFNSVCEIECQYNYIPNTHTGNLAVCGYDAEKNKLKWIPDLPSTMCQPNIIQSIKNLRINLVKSGNNYLNYAGLYKSQMNHQAIDFIWAERMAIENIYSGWEIDTTQPLVDFAFFAVVDQLDSASTLTDMFDLVKAFPTKSSTTDCLLTGGRKLVSVIAYSNENGQFASLRVNGLNCADPNRSPFVKVQVTDQLWHKFLIKETITVTFSSYVQELLFYTNVNFDLSEKCENSFSTKCPRHQVEALEFFLITKYSIETKFSKGHCINSCASVESDNCKNVVYCSEGYTG
eukprot:c20896_g1_i2.p1 GENE.c20896_g1_i2~~c20896_g1_i2.p1  ORF type:complete len:517 (+),score=138.15 c20896_g1_i2:57-1607(+)